MGGVAIVVGFVIGGGLSLLSGGETTVDADGTATTTTSPTTTTTAATTAPPETTTTTAPAARPPSEVAVRVYNGSSTAGQAVRVGDRLKTAGYNVLAPGPSPKDPSPSSTVQYGEGFAPEAAALAGLLGLPASAVVPAPTPPTVPGIGEATVVLIVGDDLGVPASP